MKHHAVSFIVLLVLSAMDVTAQTKLVAHRSHGGSIATLVVDGADSFGNPPPYEEFDAATLKQVTRVVWLSDSSALEFSNMGTDTTVGHPYWNNPKIGVDSLRKAFPTISFEGYKETRKTTKRKSKTPAERRTPVRRTSELHDPADARGRCNGVLPLVLLTTGVVGLVAGGIHSSRKSRGTT